MAPSWWIQSRSLVLGIGKSLPTPRKIALSRGSPISITILSPTFQSLQSCLMTSSRQGSSGIGENNRRHLKKSKGSSWANQYCANQIKPNHLRSKLMHPIMPWVLPLCKGMKRISSIQLPSFQNPWTRCSAITTYTTWNSWDLGKCSGTGINTCSSPSIRIGYTDHANLLLWKTLENTIKGWYDGMWS